MRGGQHQLISRRGPTYGLLLSQLAGLSTLYAGQVETPAEVGVISPAPSVPVEAERVTLILAPRRQAVLSAEVTAQVVAIRAELGERFECGETLVQLDDTIYRINMQMADARFRAGQADLARIQKMTDDQTRLRHTEAVLAAAKANLLATQRLYQDGHASQVDFEGAKRDATTAQTDHELAAAVTEKELATAEKDLAIAKGQRDLAVDELQNCSIRAPHAGHVARVLVNEHEFVDRGTPVIDVVDDSVLLAKFLLPSDLFRSVHIGQQLELTICETSDSAVARVSHVSAVFDPASATFEVHAEVDNTESKLRAGMNGWLLLSAIREPEV